MIKDNNFYINKGLSNFLNLIRWFAALLVVSTHVKTFLFKTETTNTNLFINLFNLLTSFGGEAVIIFFVLSGYLVGGKTYNDFLNNCFSWQDYLINRFLRLYIVLIPALIIGGCIDYYGIKNFSDIYNNNYNLIPFNYNIEDRLNFTTFFSNLFMLQTTLTPQFGSNGPLWSLANEFWYYLIFPLFLKIKFDVKIYSKLIYFIVLIIIVVILNKDIVAYFFIWLLGVFAFIYKGNFISFKKSFFIFIASLIICNLNLLPFSKLEALLIGLSVTCMIISLRNNTDFNLFKRFNKLSADFSYSLYLFHDPFLLFIAIYFSIPFMQDFSIKGLFYFIFLTILIIIYSYLMFFLFERNTNIIKNSIKRWIKR